ncbi:hypothetical protein BP5796_11202 [Coleophoma crateriformis]|uniref:Uncharacterized protein n=1 Tax=Coleophoma crateriformis TaxID=565419 RepID=A0A3D8QI22_9HELO|nr:hypothetical protein BP5796_11202 [Coleophoma crateriformis]
MICIAIDGVFHVPRITNNTPTLAADQTGPEASKPVGRSTRVLDLQSNLQCMNNNALVPPPLIDPRYFSLSFFWIRNSQLHLCFSAQAAGCVSDLEPWRSVVRSVDGAPGLRHCRETASPSPSPSSFDSGLGAICCCGTCLVSIQPLQAMPDDGSHLPRAPQRLESRWSLPLTRTWDAEPRRRALARTMKNMTLASFIHGCAKSDLLKPQGRHRRDGCGTAPLQQALQAIPSTSVPMLLIASGIPDLSY